MTAAVRRIEAKLRQIVASAECRICAQRTSSWRMRVEPMCGFQQTDARFDSPEPQKKGESTYADD